MFRGISHSSVAHPLPVAAEAALALSWELYYFVRIRITEDG
jgi:hypothetical protein